MTPAEYARSQGWRVGDLLFVGSIEPGHLCSIGEIVGFTRRRVVMREPHLTCLPNYKPRTMDGYKRIGRVLRPDGR